MAAKKKAKKKSVKKAGKTKSSPKTKTRKQKRPKLKYAKTKIKAGRRKLKCCPHCQDYKFCQDKGYCCEYCDFYVKGSCSHGRKRELLSADKEKIEIGDYRGDDYGIDDYEAYEDLYE